MPDRNSIDKEVLAPYFAQWDVKRESIETLYAQKDKRAKERMGEAVELYEKLLDLGGTEMDARNGRNVYRLSPLNGNERLDFVKAKLASHYAFVQLDALFSEMKKKAARLALQNKRS